MKNAKSDFHMQNWDSACRKYEEAYSIWRFYYSTNPNWSNEGIDDVTLHEVDWQGETKAEAAAAKQHKIDSLLNIAVCNLKCENYPDSLSASNEVLSMEPNNIIALQRKAKATYLPVNSSVEDLKQAIRDLRKVQKLKAPHSCRRIEK